MNNRWLTAGVKVFNESYWYRPTVFSSIELYLFSSTFFYIFSSPLLNTFWFLWLYILFSRFYSTFWNSFWYWILWGRGSKGHSRFKNSQLFRDWMRKTEPAANTLIGDGKGKQPSTKKLQHAGRYLGKELWTAIHFEPWVSILLIHMKPSEY